MRPPQTPTVTKSLLRHRLAGRLLLSEGLKERRADLLYSKDSRAGEKGEGLEDKS